MHLIVEEYKESVIPHDVAEKTQVVPWSAKSVRSLQAYGERLLDWSKSNPSVPLSDVAATLQTNRATFNHRRFVVASSREERRP